MYLPGCWLAGFDPSGRGHIRRRYIPPGHLLEIHALPAAIFRLVQAGHWVWRSELSWLIEAEMLDADTNAGEPAALLSKTQTKA